MPRASNVMHGGAAGMAVASVMRPLRAMRAGDRKDGQGPKQADRRDQDREEDFEKLTPERRQRGFRIGFRI